MLYLRFQALRLADDGTAYVGTEDGLWSSHDDGVSFGQIDIGLDVRVTVQAIAIDPSHSGRIWIGLDDNVGGLRTVRRFLDGGETWESQVPLSSESCSGITVDPVDPNKIFAVFKRGVGVWYSSDGGESWIERMGNLPYGRMLDVAHDGARVYVAGRALVGGEDFGPYVSSDDGVSWTALHDDTWPLLIVNQLAIDPNDPQVLLAATSLFGLHRSTDGGASVGAVPVLGVVGVVGAHPEGFGEGDVAVELLLEGEGFLAPVGMCGVGGEGGGEGDGGDFLARVGHGFAPGIFFVGSHTRKRSPGRNPSTFFSDFARVAG